MEIIGEIVFEDNVNKEFGKIWCEDAASLFKEEADGMMTVCPRKFVDKSETHFSP